MKDVLKRTVSEAKSATSKVDCVHTIVHVPSVGAIYILCVVTVDIISIVS